MVPTLGIVQSGQPITFWPCCIVYPRTNVHTQTTYSALQDTVLPLSAPIIGTDGREITQVPVRKGQTMFIGIRGVNRSTAIWGPDAAKWNPDRWLKPLPESVAAARIPGVYSNL